MGQYASGWCGAFSVSAGIQRLYEVGSLGGNLDAEYTWPLLEIASVRLTSLAAAAGTEAFALGSPI